LDKWEKNQKKRKRDNLSDLVDKNLSYAETIEANRQLEILSKGEIYNLAIEEGFSPAEADIVVGIAGAESGFDASNSTMRPILKKGVNLSLWERDKEDSVGLFQINWGFHTKRGVPDWMKNLGIHTREDLFDVRKNMAAAKYLYDGRGGAGAGYKRFKDWSVWKSGAWEAYRYR
jgi:hypothetical protein